MNEEVFWSRQTKEVIRYIKARYDGELEFLWERSPKNAIFRNKRNRKWYAVILTVRGDRVGLRTEGEAEILDLRFDKHQARDFAESAEHILPGYHMNKENWITVVLNESLSDEAVFGLIDRSFEIVAGEE